MPSLLPLELSVPFLVPTGVAPVARVCRALRAAALNNATWIEVFARRYPCLAELDGFDKPADARELVKSLLVATPPPKYPGAPLLPQPRRDMQGHLLPYEDNVVLVGQILVRGESSLTSTPLGTFETCDLLEARKPDDNQYTIDWLISMDDNMGNGDEYHDAMAVLRDLLQLPRRVTLDPSGAETPYVDRALFERIVTIFNARIQQELFVVAGYQIYDLGELKYVGAERMEHLAGDFFHEWRTEEPAPWFSLEFEGWINKAIHTTLTLGHYSCHDSWDPSFRRGPIHLEWIPYFALQVFANWDNHSRAHERVPELLSGVDDGDRDALRREAGEGQWNFFCRLLAAARPVHFPRVVVDYDLVE
jgi:hypothetical protein